MIDFVGLFRGSNIQKARLIGVLTDEDIVALVAERLATVPEDAARDPALAALARGQRAAARLVAKEAHHAARA
jgi:hypothetical protein